jgi:hypothetical protein
MYLAWDEAGRGSILYIWPVASHRVAEILVVLVCRGSHGASMVRGLAALYIEHRVLDVRISVSRVSTEGKVEPKLMMERWNERISGRWTGRLNRP